MISSVDPKTSIGAFNRVAAQIPLFTTDSDAPDSNRIAYLGSSNTDAGVQAGEIAKQALPDGGKCMGFVGFLGADNAVERIAGFRQAVEGSGIELVDVRGDDVDFARARSNVDDVLAASPTSTAWSASTATTRRRSTRHCRPPASSAISPSSPSTRIRSRSAPCARATSRAPWCRTPTSGATSGMKLMADYLEGDKSEIPEDGLIIVPTKKIDQSNVDAFETELKERIGS